MKIKLLLFVLLSLAAFAKEKKALDWQTGMLVSQSVTLEDAGCAGNNCGGTYHRTHYTIESEKFTYVANREGDHIDVVVKTSVRFAISGGSLYLMDSKGKPHECHLEQVVAK